MGVLHPLKGAGNRALHRCVVTRLSARVVPPSSSATRLFGLFTTHQDWTRTFLAAPTVLGVIDTSGIELIHSRREGRSPQHIGRIAGSTLQWLMQQVDGRMMVLSDTGFQAAEGDPANLTRCQYGTWQDRLLLETVIAMLTLVCHCTKGMHRVWPYVHARSH